MPFMPTVPGWDGIHPLIVHFPIALLLATPVLLILGIIFPDGRRVFSISGFVTMLMGTVAAYVAVESGEAAAELVTRTPQISAVLERHIKMAETTRDIFTVLTLVFAAILFVPTILRKPMKRGVFVVTNVVFLVLYSAAALYVADTGHYGGKLVHEFGVRAMISPTPVLPGRE